MISSDLNYDKSAVILMPIVSKIRTAFIKEGQPHEEASPPKHSAVPVAYVQRAHPCGASYPRTVQRYKEFFD